MAAPLIVIRPKDEPGVAALSAGDKVLIDGGTTRSILAAALLSGTVQIITAPGDVTVAITDGLIILNKTLSQATAVNLPPSATKIGRVKIVDWKGDSGSFPITVNNNGAEKFNANQASWVISGAGASDVFDPIPTGLGYAV